MWRDNNVFKCLMKEVLFPDANLTFVSAVIIRHPIDLHHLYDCVLAAISVMSRANIDTKAN